MLSLDRTAAAPDPRVQAVVAPAPDRTFIEIDDQDGDGIADWKQTLPSVGLRATTTASTTPETHTRTVAVNALQRLMESNMQPELGEGVEGITGDIDTYIQSLAIDTLLVEADISLSDDTSSTALRAYGNSIARIVRDNAMEGEVATEIELLERALQANDPELLADLARIAASYEGMIADMRALSVPRTYVKEHLDLVNTYQAMLINIRAFEAAFTDPVYSLVRFQRHQEDMRGVWQAIVNVYTELHEDGIRWTDADIASEFITVEE